MERKEPHFGTPDLSDVEFRPTHRRGPAPSTTNAVVSFPVWKLALGIFLGLSAFGIGTLVFLGFAAQAAIEEQERRERAAMEQFKKSLADPDPFGVQAQMARQRATEAARAARVQDAARLKSGERCVNGVRLRRVENGWVQSGSC